MMHSLKYTAALAAVALFAACTRDRLEEEAPLPPCSDMPICWNVTDVAAPTSGTRVVIGELGEDPSSRPVNPADPDFFITPEEVCDETKKAKFAVGLFGDYSYKDENDQLVTEYDLYRGARLVYLPDASDDLPSKWDTDAGMKYWQPRAKYLFRAYYPQRLYGYTIQTSNATTFAMTYPSRKLQYDLLIGVAEVDTNAEGWRSSDAVELKLSHALAALRFEFELNFEDADFLTSVYLLNDEMRHFFSQGTISYGKEGDIHSLEWLQDYNPPASEVLYKWVPPLKYWYGVDSDKDGVFEELSADAMLEKWGWVNGKPENVPLKLGLEGYNPVLMYSIRQPSNSGSNAVSGVTNGIQYTSKAAGAYYGMEEYYDWVTDKDWKESAAEEVAAEGKLYCRNSGWLLIPPQESFGEFTLCFTTKKGGRTLYKVKLPQKTETEVGKNGKVIVDENGQPVTGLTDAEGNRLGRPAWAAGYRYTYLVKISQSNLAVEVSIKPWNERKHSTEIIF